MKVQSLKLVYFSPTGTTKTITESILQGIEPESTEIVDATKRNTRNQYPLSFRSDLVIIATPVYYGRVPEEAATYFALFTAERTPVVLAWISMELFRANKLAKPGS